MKTAVGGTWALRQMQLLAARGVEVHVALPPGPLVKQYLDSNIRVHTIDALTANPVTAVRFGRRVRHLHDQILPQVISSHFVNTTMVARIALGKHHATPRLFHVPGPLHLEHEATARAELATAGERDGWVGSCTWTQAEYARRGVPAERSFMIYNGMDIDSFVPRPAGTLRRELRLADDVPIVGMLAYAYAPKRFLGQTRGLKGHEDAIDAMVRVRKTHPSALLVFVGGPWGNAQAYFERVVRYGKERLGDGVVFLGTRSDVRDMYADFKIALYPSHTENLGGTSEGALLGVPLIATRVGGHPDMVRDGETGWLVPPHRPNELAAAILDAFARPEEAARRAAAAQRRAHNILDIRRTVNEVEAAYDLAAAW